jgi:hypothetical protein
MQPDSSLPCSQELNNGPYLEPDELNAHPQTCYP